MASEDAVAKGIGEAGPAGRVRKALTEFLRLESAGGILLVLAAVVALIIANSPLKSLYE
ncbi:MAG: Na+/H+ antiporter NhaA, partial [Gammaproteobacteria bacterium]